MEERLNILSRDIDNIKKTQIKPLDTEIIRPEVENTLLTSFFQIIKK